MIYYVNVNLEWYYTNCKKFLPTFELFLEKKLPELGLSGVKVLKITVNVYEIIIAGNIDLITINNYIKDIIPNDVFQVSGPIDENNIEEYVRYLSSSKFDPDKILFETNEEIKKEESSSDDGIEFDFFDIPEEEVKPKPPVEKKEEKPDLASVIKKVQELRQTLTSKVIGQNHVIESVLNSYFGMMTLKNNTKKPRGVYLFAGPPGTGKTMMANIIAEELGIPYKVFQMSEYSAHHSTDTFIGTNGTYRNSSPGKLTEFVKDNPRSLLIFDEIEKSHQNILNIFLQILDNGIVADTYTKEDVCFSETIIIMTSNAGKNLYEDETINIPGISKKQLVNALSTDIDPLTEKPFFSQALLSRITTGTICMFNKLEPYYLRIILGNRLKDDFDTFVEQYNIKVNIDDDVVSTLLYSLGGVADARSLVGLAENFVKKELFDILDLAAHGKVDINSIKNINLSLDYERCPQEVLSLMAPTELTVLFICSSETKEVIEKIKLDKINFKFATNVDDAKRLLRTDVSVVALDLLLNLQDKDIPANLEDIYSDGVDILNYIKTYQSELSLYILNDVVHKYTALDYQSFLAFSARGVINFDISQNETIINDINLVKDKVLVEKTSNTLKSSNNIVNYNCAQYFEGDTVDVKLQRLSLKRNVSVEDNTDILSDVSKPNIKFSDVIGAEDAKETLVDFLRYLKNPKKYTETGVRPPRGVLLYGPPGTGKTLLAKALAGESNVAFLHKNSTEFFKQYVGQSPESVRNLFKQARKYAPAIIFIDECDAFAKKRTGSENARHEEGVLTTFLSELDGFVFNEKKPVLVVAATNYEISGNGPTVLDPAFVRRFDRKICVGLPNTEERARFLRYYLSKHGITTISNDTIENIALRTIGYSPAKLELIVELAIRNAKGTDVTDDILEESIDIDANGKERKWSEEYVRQTSYHEAGHTLVSWLCGKKPTFVTNVSRGDYGGYMMSEVDESKGSYTKQDILDRICCCLAGRAAEVIKYGEASGVNTGASGDLAQATEHAKTIVAIYGMDDSLVSWQYESFGSAVEARLYEKIDSILQQQMARAIDLISHNMPLLEELTNELLSKNSLTKNEIEDVLSRRYSDE